MPVSSTSTFGLSRVPWTLPNDSVVTCWTSPLSFIFVVDVVFKGISDAHCAGEDVSALLEWLKVNALPYREWQARWQKHERDELERASLPVLIRGDLFAFIEQKGHHSGWGGDPALLRKIYITAATRLLEQRPGALSRHVALTRPAGEDQSTVAYPFAGFVPEDAVLTIPASSCARIYHEADSQHQLPLVEGIGSIAAMTTDGEHPLASAIR